MNFDTKSRHGGVLTASAAAIVFLSILGALVTARQAAQSPELQRIDLVQHLAAGKLRAVNREVTKLQSRSDGVRVTEREGPGVVWIEGTDFAEGTVELDVRGRDVPQRSFVGVSFHRRDDNTYDSVYVRPFNFRNPDPARRANAVQYMALPDYDWPRLRKEFPGEFERPVDASIVPTEWVPLKVVVSRPTIQVYVGNVTTPTLQARKLGQHDRGLIGLWTGNNSDGDFANLRIIRGK
jgi:hypothetical protein